MNDINQAELGSVLWIRPVFQEILGPVYGQTLPAQMTLRLALGENHRRTTSFAQA
jgi:hypothetical protein